MGFSFLLHVFPCSSLNTFLRPNQDSSAWLFIRLQIHVGVNTSAKSLVLSALVSIAFSVRGLMTSAESCLSCISESAGWQKEFVPQRMFLPVVMSCSNKGRTDEINGLLRSIGLVDAFVSILIYIIVHAGRLLSLGERIITRQQSNTTLEENSEAASKGGL